MCKCLLFSETKGRQRIVLTFCIHLKSQSRVGNLLSWWSDEEVAFNIASLNNIQFLRISFVVVSLHDWNTDLIAVYVNHVFRLMGSEPHSRKPFAPIIVFLSHIDRLWNKILWQTSVHFRHPWRIKKTDFTREVITRVLSKINKRIAVCERMLLDSN